MSLISLIKQYSLSRNGLMTINFISNVRNIAEDIRVKQHNEKIKLAQSQGLQTKLESINDKGERYEVSNSYPNFDANEEATLDEILETLTIPILKQLLKTLKVSFESNMRKADLIQLLKQSVQRNNQYIQYIKNAYTNYLSELRANRQKSLRDVNSTLLVSNFYKYKRSDFDGMSFKDIVRTLFDIDDHLIFIANKVLKGETIPKTPSYFIMEALANIKKINGSSTAETKKLRKAYLENESNKNNKILKANSELILSLLFEAKRPFYINKKKYTILSYHQENEPAQDPEEGIELAPRGSYANYSVYPVNIYLELTELPADKVSNRVIQSSSCHLKKEKMRKNWFDIWNPDNSGVFERNHRKTLKRGFTYGGKKMKKTRKL